MEGKQSYRDFIHTHTDIHTLSELYSFLGLLGEMVQIHSNFLCTGRCEQNFFQVVVRKRIAVPLTKTNERKHSDKKNKNFHVCF